jgi:hypothetical protein
MMKSGKKCTDNGSRVKAAMKAAGKGKQSNPAYGKPMKDKNK